MVTGGEDPNATAQERRNHVKGMMQHAWDNYVKYAWGENELRPVSKNSHTSSIIFGSGSMGATIVDSLDTLYIMGMKEEYEKAKTWIQNEMDISKMGGYVSVFEMNIRYVGGLLSAYALTGEETYKDKASSIVDKLLPAFDTATGIPYSYINMQTGVSTAREAVLSEFGTLHMEFRKDVVKNASKQKVSSDTKPPSHVIDIFGILFKLKKNL